MNQVTRSLSGMMPRLSRRELLLLSMGAWRAWPQSAYPGTAYRDYSRCLPDYLRNLAREAFERRNSEIAKLSTPAAIATRQRWVTETFWQITGGKPERTPLRPRTLGSFERTGYRLEKRVHQNRPGPFLTAHPYPTTARKPPYPRGLLSIGPSPHTTAPDAASTSCLR